MNSLYKLEITTRTATNKQQLLEHARDTLVKAGWNMGEGRAVPPLSYIAFVKAWDTWIQKGSYAPAK